MSCPLIDEIVSLANEFDYSAKLTGGGGGGCVIAICRKDSSKCDILSNELAFMKRLQESGYCVNKISIGGKGLQVELLEEE